MERIADHSGDVGLGYLYRYRFTASLVGYYAAMMDFEICKVVVDGELAYDTLKKYGVTVVS